MGLLKCETNKNKKKEILRTTDRKRRRDGVRIT
jgi:hypothetical protein